MARRPGKAVVADVKYGREKENFDDIEDGEDARLSSSELAALTGHDSARMRAANSDRDDVYFD